MNRYSNPILDKTIKGKPFFKSKAFPSIPLSEDDVYIMTTSGDRLDLIANQYYGDAELWWVISMVNNNITKGLIYPTPGTQLRIPTRINDVLSLVENYNKAR